ncbi:MAG: fluoride efflux transporter CrcB [Caldilineae bacterium]|nr:MAG: fluoride efflux transporter CrcB [Caldilineae bacterium]
MSRYLYIAIGAALGANARYLVGVWAGGRFGAGFPYGTFLVNVTGSLILGFLLTLATGRLALSSEMRLLLAVGFLGSYTTFSSYTVESLALMRGGSLGSGLLNIFANNLLGLAAALIGVLLAQWLNG